MKHLHHIIPRHAGGTDDPSNLVELTPEEHAEAHRILYEEHGHWQDRVAWIGLAGLATKAEHVAMLWSEAGKKGGAMASRKRPPHSEWNFPNGKPDHKGANNPCAREYIVEHPDGTKEDVKALKVWCEDRDINYNTFHAMCIGRGRSHKGFKATKV